jgi:hypothetical protein
VPNLARGDSSWLNRITYVELDVHKEGIVVAVAEGGDRGGVREYSTSGLQPGGTAYRTALRWLILGYARERPAH